MSVYLALLRRPGARPLAIACTLGWLAFMSQGFAVVLLVAHRTGSFAAAGAAVAAFGAGAALLAPLRGRLVDLRGTAALVAFGTAQAAGLVLLLVAPRGVATVAAAGVAGAAAPPLIATARAFWPAVAGPELTRAAHALNALLGEVGAVTGPALAAGLSAWLGPPAALTTLAVCPLAGCLIVARLGVPHVEAGIDGPADALGTPPHAVTVGQRALGAVHASAGLRTLLFVDVWIGLAIGALDVTAPALAREEGAAELAAVPLAAFAVGSLASSLWAGRSSVSAERRFVAGSVLMAVGLGACALVSSVAALAAVLVAAGAAYGVLNVGVFELLDVVVARERAVEALTWLTTAGGIGISVGAALAGQLAADDPRSALLLTALAMVPGALLAVTRRRTLSTAAAST